MKKKVFLHAIISALLFVIFGFGFSSWLIISPNLTKNPVNHDPNSNEMVDLNVHYRTLSAETKTTYEYFVPDQVSVTHNISATDKDGNTKYQEFTSSDIKITNPDKKIQYYDVDENGKYTAILQHVNSYGPEQIKSLNVEVNSWKPAQEGEYGVVWKTQVDPNDSSTALKFTCDQGNGLYGHGHKYEIGGVYRAEEEIFNETVETDGISITTIIFQRITVYDRQELTYGKKSGFIPYKAWFYYPQYEQRKLVIKVQKGVLEEVSDVKTIQVKKGTTITPFDLQVEGSKNYGYYSDADYTNLFDFKVPINERGDIYLQFIAASDNLTSSINALGNGQTLNLHDSYKGGTGDGINIPDDPTYYQKINGLFFDACTLNTGATLNLTYENEKIYELPITGSIGENLGNHRNSKDSSISEEYLSNENIGKRDCSCFVLLNGDMTVRGTLNIGAKVGGGPEGGSRYSYIIGQYSTLDLYGHTLTIEDGGRVNAYGIIKDSVGTGKIIVKKGGKLQSVLTVSDGRGRDSSAIGISKRQSPFTEYRLSYLQTSVKFYYGSTFTGYLKADFSSLGIANVYIDLFGEEITSGSNQKNALFSWSNTDFLETDYVSYEAYQITTLLSNAAFVKDMYQWRNKFEIHASLKVAGSYILNTSFTTPLGNLNIDIDFARLDTPISPFFDIILATGYKLEAHSKLTFYPGSSFYAQKNSTLIFKSDGEKTFNEISKGLTIAGETRTIAGGMMGYTSRIQDISSSAQANSKFNVGVYNMAGYWEYVKPANLVIDGDIEIDPNIDTTKSDGFYYISGNILMSDRALRSLKENKEYIKTYDLKAELKSGFFYDNSHQNINDQHLFASGYNMSPLNSGKKSYILDKNHDLEGYFDPSNGIFTSEIDGQKYFLKTGVNMYEGGSSGSSQSSRVDRNIEIVPVKDEDVDENNRIVIEGSGQAYLYYCGIYVPIYNFDRQQSIGNNTKLTVNARKFMSNEDGTYSINIKRITPDDSTAAAVSTNVSKCFTNLVVNFKSSTSKWEYYAFEAYPKTGNDVWYSYS